MIYSFQHILVDDGVILLAHAGDRIRGTGQHCGSSCQQACNLLRAEDGDPLRLRRACLQERQDAGRLVVVNLALFPHGLVRGPDARELLNHI